MRVRAAEIAKVANQAYRRHFSEKTGRCKLRLDDLAIGEGRRIAEIIHDTDGHWRKLVAFGLMPGVDVRMLQRWPTLVVRVGRTDVGLDETIAKLVLLAA